VIASVDHLDLVIDLRWIAAADDGKLAEALGEKLAPVGSAPVESVT
jgi:hypothetical protein